MVEIDTTKKNNILVGLLVDIIEDKNKGTETYTRGYVKRLISNKDCKKGIKVELTNGAIGHVKYIPSKNEAKKENFKFYNEFFYGDIYSLWDKKEKKFCLFTRINKLTQKEENTIFLFSSKEIANFLIKNTSLENYLIRPIKRSKSINEFFKDYNVDVYSIDTKRKLSVIKMDDYEKYFKSF